MSLELSMGNEVIAVNITDKIVAFSKLISGGGNNKKNIWYNVRNKFYEGKYSRTRQYRGKYYFR